MYLDVILVVPHVIVLVVRDIRYENALLLPNLSVVRLVGLEELAQSFSTALYLIFKIN